MSNRQNRKGIFEVDNQIEGVISKANSLLSDFDKEIDIEFDESNLPQLIFISYAPRTGSTVFAQCLSLTNEFSHFSNFTARFWKAPIFAALLEQEVNLKDQRFFEKATLKSVYGTSKNPVFPHEFGFFWNQFLTDDTHHINTGKLSSEKKTNLVSTINKLRAIYGKPFFIKNGIAGMNTALISELFPDAKFIVIRRDITSTAKSIYKARKEIYGDKNNWWSLMPDQTSEIISKYPNDPFRQIISQLKAIYQEVEKGISDPADSFTVEYEEFCQNPQEIVKQVFSFLKMEPKEDWNKYLPLKLKNSSGSQLSEDEKTNLETAINELV